MFSVLIKPCYYLVKYRILYVLFLMIPSISQCAGEQNPVDLVALNTNITTLMSTMQNHFDRTSNVLAKIESGYDSITSINRTATIVHRNASEVLNKIKLEVLPEMTGTLKQVSDNATQLMDASTTQQDNVYKILSEWQANLTSTLENCDIIGHALIEIQRKVFFLTQAANDANLNQLSFNREAASLNSIYKEFTKIVSDFKVDVGITKSIFEDSAKEFHNSTVEFKKLGEIFSTTVENQLKNFSGTIKSDMKQYMELTGRFNKLESNLVDAVNQANLPKEFKFDTTTVVDFCKRSEVKSLKTDWNNISDYSVLKPYLEQGFRKMAEQGNSFNDTEGLADLSVQVLSNFSFNH